MSQYDYRLQSCHLKLNERKQGTNRGKMIYLRVFAAPQATF